MSLKDDVSSAATTAIWTDWSPRESNSIPKSEDIGLTTGDAVGLNGVWLYADLRDSSGLAQRLPRETAATCISAYLRCTSHIIRHTGGAIRSFDGDRVMAIYKVVNTAVRTAQLIVGAVETILRPNLELRFPSLTGSNGWEMDVGIGIDWGEAMMIRGGVRGNNDLVSIGSAPNVAAKLGDVRSGGKSIFITAPCHSVLDDTQRYAPSTGEDMWARVENQVVGGTTIVAYGSGWYKHLA